MHNNSLSNPPTKCIPPPHPAKPLFNCLQARYNRLHLLACSSTHECIIFVLHTGTFFNPMA